MDRRRKQRVGVACDFCRQRKFGCDNAKPKCEKCKCHGKECTYSERRKNERPSNSRISHLEEENTRLRTSLASLQSQSELDQAQNNTNEQAAKDVRPAIASHPEISHIPGGAQEIRFHGPSSAIYDREFPHKKKKIDSVDLVSIHSKNQLLADASKQRQLEVINLRSKKLDFDGVDPETGMQLLSVFWNRQHYSGSVVYRPCFMRDMACRGPYFSSLLLNAILFVATKHSPSYAGQCETNDTCAGGGPFRRKVEGLLFCSDTQILCKSKITTAQALLLMSDALFSWCDEKSLSWHYLGIAINMIIDLGIHTEKVHRARHVEDLEINRRLFWAAYVLDKAQSIYQGRPARLREMDNQVPILFLDEYDELEPFHTLSYSETPSQLGTPTHSVSTFEHLCKLSVLADRILGNIYSEKSFTGDAGQLYQSASSLHADLERWRESLPPHLTVHSGDQCEFQILPHSLSLLSMFHSLVILLHRPFVSDGHLQYVTDSTASDAFARCINAAAGIDSILRLYKRHFCLKTCPYFISYATYVSATIHVRIAAQRVTGSQAHRSLRNCLEVLSEHQVYCHAPRQSMGILLGLVRRLNVDVEGDYRAAMSRSEAPANGADDASLPMMGLSLPSRETPVGRCQTSSNDGQVECDTGLTDLDIDDVMRSFGPVSRTTRSLYRRNASDDCMAASALNLNGDRGTNSTSNQLDNMLPSPYDAFGFDPLFGFDIPMVDIDPGLESQ